MTGNPIGGEVVARRPITDELAVVRIRPETGVEFQAGQYLLVEIGGVVRPYSIASAPGRPELEFFLEGPSGRIEPGCRVTVARRGAGTLTLDDDRPGQLMIATVTGVSPFLSMIRHRLTGSRPESIFYLLHGASYADEFAFTAEIARLATDNPGRLHYVPTVSRPSDRRNAGWNGSTGRVNEIVADQVRRFDLRPEATRVYACGHAGMISDVRRQMYRLGFTLKVEEHAAP